MINRRQVIAFGVMLLLTVTLTSSSDAQPTTGGFLAANSGSTAVNLIPEFNPSLSNDGNTVFSTVTITAADINPSNNGTIVDSFFTIEGLTHSNISDLTVRVRHVALDGVERVATLFERVGISDAGLDNGGNGFVDNQNVDGFGDSSNVSGTYRFQDGGSSLFVAAAATADAAVIPTLNTATGLPVFAASGTGNQPVSLSFAFNTDSAGNALSLDSVIGDFIFEISDRSNQTPVTTVAPAGIQSFTQTNVAFVTAIPVVSAVPEPTTASAMLLALLGMAARRRRA